MVRWFAILFCVAMLGLFVAGAAVIWIFYEFGRGLPDHRQLATYDPPVMTRIYAGDGRLVEEYAVEGRVFVPISAIPRRVSNAFVAAEDQRFYRHPGVDPIGLARVVVTNVLDKLRGVDRRMKGASSITQQVAQNFLIGREYRFDRKIREAILALRLERAFTKDHILELYLNEVYFGFGSYGIAAAAMNYFNKSLDELTLSETAFLAGVLKGPTNYNPQRYPEAARERRDYVLGRMLEDGYATPAEVAAARQEPIIVRRRGETELVDGGRYFAEEVRRALVSRYGSDSLYKGGLAVRTSLEPALQALADRTLRQGLLDYDRRHGWRGPIASIAARENLLDHLRQVQAPQGMPAAWQMALVTDVTPERAELLLSGGGAGTVPLPELTWARAWMPDQKLGEPVKSAGQVLRPGDVVAVEPVAADAEGRAYPGNTFTLRQMPAIDGSMVVMDPHTGRVLAISGGFSFERSEFNRATQALRQPGSSFKPFVYLAAMENGYTPSTLVLDAPFVMDQGPGLPKWKPKNYTTEYLGLATLRTGMEKSQNLMTVRLAQAVGMDKVASVAQRFGIYDQMPQNLASSLGSEVSTLLRMTSAYAMLVNGGKKLTPTLIDRVQDRNGNTVERYDSRACIGCRNVPWEGQEPPALPDNRQQLSDPASVYQVVHMMEGVVERGTGRALRAVGKPLGGKSGTSNEAFDTWFIGFSPDLVAGVFVGFDEPRTLGPRESGGGVAAPIVRDFMLEALKDAPATPFRVPPGISLVQVNHDTGKQALAGERNVILEAFKSSNLNVVQATIMGVSDQEEGMSPSQPSAGGLY